MKSYLIFLAIIACVSGDVNPRSLHQDLQDFLALIPHEELRVVAKTYLDNDEEFQAMVVYMQSPQWANLVLQIRSNPKWIDFKEYLSKSGVDIEGFIAYIHNLIMGATPGNLYKKSRGLKGFFEDVSAVLPDEQLNELLLEKLSISYDFQDFYLHLASENNKKLFEEVLSMPEVENIIRVLKSLEVDVDGFISRLYKFFWW